MRRALQLRKRDKIHYTIRPGGEVVLSRAEPTADDPMLGQFLRLLARDMASHPEHVRAVDAGLVQRLQALTCGIEVDLGAALAVDDE